MLTNELHSEPLNTENYDLFHVPQILPDEWVNGYIERFALLNGFDSGKSLAIALNATRNHGVSLIELMAKFLLQTTPMFVWQHSLIPALRCITDNQHSQLHGDTTQQDILHYLGMRQINPNVRVCSKCHHEDIGYWGFPYLRRSHQFFGIDYCQKHNWPLIKINTKDTSSIFHLPLPAIPAYIFQESPNNHPIISMYAEIMEGLTGLKQPISAEHVSWVLSQQAKNLGVQISAKGQGLPLSDLAIQKTPMGWLKEYFLILANKNLEEFIPSIDGVCIFRFQNHTAPHYVLAAALLFNSADEALNQLINTSSESKPATQKKLRRPKSYWQSDALFSLYVKSNGNCKMITSEIGGNYEQNRVNLCANGLPPLSRLSNANLTALKDYYLGAPTSEIIRRLDINLHHIQAILNYSSDRFGNAIVQIYDNLIANNLIKTERFKTKEPQIKASSKITPLKEIIINKKNETMQPIE